MRILSALALAALTAGPAAPAIAAAAAPAPVYAAVVPGRAIEFPSDHGSHPDFRTEWWYVTGWLATETGENLGFQVTFFRTKPGVDDRNPSAFTARQLLIGHCALSDPARGRLWQDQRIRRAGLGLAEAAVGDTDVRIDRWTLKRESEIFQVRIDAQDFSLSLNLAPGQPPLLHGVAGLSSKGPAPQAASYYYSLPHLKVSGAIARGGREARVSGEAWLDHEWSSEYLDDQAVGWDWIGINLDDGSALMAFRMRGTNGEIRWAGATRRDPKGIVRVFDPADVSIAPAQTWRSPRTGIQYPVSVRVRVGSLDLELLPLLEDQENDARLSAGAIYWEGAVRAYEQKRLVGRGYLELTGYGERLHLR